MNNNVLTLAHVGVELVVIGGLVFWSNKRFSLIESELGILNKKVEHILNVLSSQQQYANSSMNTKNEPQTRAYAKARPQQNDTRVLLDPVEQTSPMESKSQVQVENKTQTQDKNPNIRLLLRNVKGEIFPLEIKPTNKVQTLKVAVQAKFNTDIDKIQLIFNGKKLEDDKTFVEQDVKADSVIHFVVNNSPPKSVTFSDLHASSAPEQSTTDNSKGNENDTSKENDTGKVEEMDSDDSENDDLVISEEIKRGKQS